MTINTYENLQMMKQQFLAMWSQEYLNEVQIPKYQDTKFKKMAAPIIVQLFLLLKWHGLLLFQLHPGEDSIIQIVSLRTDYGTTKRAVAKICLFY